MTHRKEWYKYKQAKRRASAFVEQTRTLDEKDIDLYWETNVEKPIWEAYFRVICKEERSPNNDRTLQTNNRRTVQRMESV